SSVSVHGATLALELGTALSGSAELDDTAACWWRRAPYRAGPSPAREHLPVGAAAGCSIPRGGRQSDHAEAEAHQRAPLHAFRHPWHSAAGGHRAAEVCTIAGFRGTRWPNRLLVAPPTRRAAARREGRPPHDALSWRQAAQTGSAAGGSARQDASVRRLRGAVVLAACAVLAVGFAALAVADPFHLRHIRWFTATAVLLAVGFAALAVADPFHRRHGRWCGAGAGVLAVILGTAAFAVLVRGALRLVVLGIGGIAVLGWVAIVVLAAQVSVENHTITEVADGGRRLVVVAAAPTPARPVYAVVVRSGTGLFEQEAVVYQGVEAGPAPSDVRFVDADTVEVRTGPCVYRSEVEAVTLEVDPVYRTLRPDTC